MKSIFKAFLLSLLMIGQVHWAYAQTASLLPNAVQQFFDNNGNPLSSGTVTTYVPNTTTLKTTWQDGNQTTPWANPLTLNAAGRPPNNIGIFGNGSYRQVVKDRNNNIIWDQVTSSASGSSGGGSAATGDGDAVGTIKPWAGMTAPNQYAFAYGQEVSRTTYSALFTAITSSQAGFCTSGSPTVGGLGDTTNFWIGMSVELSCVAAGFSTIVSKTASTVTLAANANVTSNVTAIFFTWGRGNGLTTFNLPDFRGVVPVGNNNMGGIASANLTTTYFGATNPNSIGALGGSQNSSTTIVTANLPPYTPVGTNGSISVGFGGFSIAVTNGTLGTALGTTGAGTAVASTTTNFTSAVTALTGSGSTFTGTPQGGTSTPILTSRVPPSKTVNYIVKITPDTVSGTTVGVTSIASMTGDIACGTGLLCTGNTISITAGSASLIVGTTPITAGTNTRILYDNAGVLGEYSSVPVAVGGTGGTAASGTLLDNITGFAGTGFLTRTGAGAYAFQSTTNGITNANLAQAAAYTLKGNNSGALGNVSDIDIPTLTTKASPAAGDYIMLSDQAAAGAFKKATIASIASAGSVSSINGQTGAITLGTITPQVRMTLVSATPVMASSQAGANTVYVTPYGGCLVPIYDGTNMVPTCFAEVSQLTTDTTKSPAAVAASSVYDVFCWIDTGPTNRCTRGPAWSNDTIRSAGTALVLVNGIWLNNASITNGPAAQRGTYVGSFRSDGSSLVNYVYGGYANPCTGANFAVWNAYNRVPVRTSLGLTATSWTYNGNAAWRQINGATSCIVNQLRGLNEDPVSVKYNALATPGATNGAVGIGIDTNTAFTGSTSYVASGETLAKNIVGEYSGIPGLGYHSYSAIEFNSVNGVNTTFFGTAGTTYIQTGIHAEVWQ